MVLWVNMYSEHYNDNKPSALPWLPWPYQYWSCLKVIVLRKFLNLFLWLKIKLQTMRRPRRLSCFLRNLKLDDINNVCTFQWMRASNSKIRSHHYIQYRGLCILYNEDNSIIKAFRTILAITLLNISKLNTLNFAPGWHMGYYCIWTGRALHKADNLFGTWHKFSFLIVTKIFPHTSCSIQTLEYWKA